MARVKGGVVSRKRRKRILKLAKGYYGAKHILFRTAKEQVMNSYYYAYRDRRQKKRDFRKLWITRINAAARLNGLSYSQLMQQLSQLLQKLLKQNLVNNNDQTEEILSVFFSVLIHAIMKSIIGVIILDGGPKGDTESTSMG